MNDLCNCENPHGCCHPDSSLCWIWSIPLIVISCPIWSPIMICVECYKGTVDIIDNNIKWSEEHKNNNDSS
jgi:hypothetical protein